MTKIFKILSEEHQNILKVINDLLKECDTLESKNELNLEFFNKTIDFIINYADKFHHAKEEDILFIELNKEGVQMPCNPIEQMLHEHELGRNYINELKKQIDENNIEKIIENSRGYASLLQEHIYKEDNILYPMAEEALSEDTKNKILNKFNEIENKL
ncbi:hemerythrin [bacterium]|jgi:hemerythrin-like domain-containing protein|nr:hemerythrin [bacterium]MBT4335601.1 hemerythrin [bacterium]MBT4495465.1 hemerythrin [bacterium]MBT4764263.1 hemerythrin [bacterium]MBT5401635.1 hemerythrin [bacterium]